MIALGVIVILLTVYNGINYYKFADVGDGGLILEILVIIIFLFKGGFTDVRRKRRD